MIVAPIVVNQYLSTSTYIVQADIWSKLQPESFHCNIKARRFNLPTLLAVGIEQRIAVVHMNKPDIGALGG